MSMQLDLAGKSVLVTGASRGIGLHVAKAFLEEGCRVVLNGRNQQALQSASAALEKPITAVIVGDMSVPEAAQNVVRRAEAALGGSLDILVCNVGGGASVPPGQETAAEWHRVFALNLWSTTNAVEAATESLRKTKGAVVCISSICGVEVVPGAPVTYSVAKAALNAYVRSMARPLGRKNVRINAVAPGNILFEGSVWDRKSKEDPQAVHEMLERDVALATLGETRDIAGWTLWLASPRCNFATGGIYVVDGGQVRS